MYTFTTGWQLPDPSTWGHGLHGARLFRTSTLQIWSGSQTLLHRTNVPIWRPQKGRYRQFYQIDAEVFGVENPCGCWGYCHAHPFFKKGRLEKLELQINSLGCRACRPRYREALKEFLTKKSFQLLKIVKGGFRRILAHLWLQGWDLSGGIRMHQSHWLHLPECQKHFDQVKKYLEMVELTYILNPRMVRGLDYYTRTAFEVVSYQLGLRTLWQWRTLRQPLPEIGSLDVQGSVCYWMERLVSLLPKDKEFIQTLHLFIAALGEEPLKEAYRLVNQLHLKGIRAELDYEGKSLKSQMRRADKLKARYVLIWRRRIKTGESVLRNMESKSRKTSDKRSFNYLKSKIFEIDLSYFSPLPWVRGGGEGVEGLK